VERVKFLPIRLYLAFQGLRDELRDDESGQAMVEYALILALVSVAAIGILKILGTTVSGVFSKINADLGGV
jgi:Flp pilus assembly pilin Flp